MVKVEKMLKLLMEELVKRERRWSEWWWRGGLPVLGEKDAAIGVVAG